MIFFLEKLHKNKIKKFNNNTYVVSTLVFSVKKNNNMYFFNLTLFFIFTFFILVFFLTYLYLVFDFTVYCYLDHLVNKNCILNFKNIFEIDCDTIYDTRSNLLLVKYLFL